jgi:hypothetical protein
MPQIQAQEQINSILERILTSLTMLANKQEKVTDQMRASIQLIRTLAVQLAPIRIQLAETQASLAHAMGYLEAIPYTYSPTTNLIEGQIIVAHRTTTISDTLSYLLLPPLPVPVGSFGGAG